MDAISRRPDWHADDDDNGGIKIIMTGAAVSDPVEYHPHIRGWRLILWMRTSSCPSSHLCAWRFSL
jgi:type I restriction enzyme R subunit